MINRSQLKTLVRRTLKKYKLYSEDAEHLILCTIAQESKFGYYLRQAVRNFAYKRHAIGICQMEKATFEDLKRKYGIRFGLNNISFKELEYNLEYSILFCRLKYLSVPLSLPNRFDFNAVWQYYKRHYNTYKGSATKAEFLLNYKKYVEKKS